MEKITEAYIDHVSNLLNGQIRGVINKRALEENLKLIQLSMVSVWEIAEKQTEKDIMAKLALDKLREDLKDE